MSGWELEKISEVEVDEYYVPDDSEIQSEDIILEWEEFMTAVDTNFLTDEDGYALDGTVKILPSEASSMVNHPEKIVWINK
jgi:hypothetical protein